MRFRTALPALAGSLVLHAAAAAWFLPDSLEQAVAGGQQASVLGIGTVTIHALMVGTDRLEA